MEQPGSPTQGALVTEGTDAEFSRLWFQAEALEFFSGLQSLGPLGPPKATSSPFTHNAKENEGVLGRVIKTK